MFKKGNEYHKFAENAGRPPTFESAQDLWAKYELYCDWIKQNPLIEIDYKGKDATRVELEKMRIQTKAHFALFCGMSRWEGIHLYRKKGAEYSEVIARIEESIYYQKLAGAAAGLLNPNIIARDLGLREQTDVTTAGKSLNEPFTPDERAQRIAALQSRLKLDQGQDQQSKGKIE